MNRRGEKKLKEEWRNKIDTRQELSDNVCVVSLPDKVFLFALEWHKKTFTGDDQQTKNAIKENKKQNGQKEREIEEGPKFSHFHLHILSRWGITAKYFICLFFFGNQKCNGWFSNGGITTKYVGCLDQSVSLSFFEYVPGCI